MRKYDKAYVALGVTRMFTGSKKLGKRQYKAKKFKRHLKTQHPNHTDKMPLAETLRILPTIVPLCKCYFSKPVSTISIIYGGVPNC